MDVHWLYWISITYPLKSVDNQHISTYVWWIFTGYSLDIQWITNAYPLILAEYTMDLQWISGCYRISSIQSIGFQTNPLDIHLNPRRYPPQLHKNALEWTEIHLKGPKPPEIQVDIHKLLPDIHWIFQWITGSSLWISTWNSVVVTKFWWISGDSDAFLCNWGGYRRGFRWISNGFLLNPMDWMLDIR